MFNDPFLHKALIALLLGLLIGTQREKSQMDRKERDFGGVRSFTIITLLGYFSAYLTNFGTTIAITMISIGVISLIVASYVYESFVNNRKGITAELAALMAFLLGMITYFETTFAVIAGIILTLIISLKVHLHAFVGKISSDEYFATLKFAIIAFVILPILPNEALDTWGVVNLYKIWLMVVLISGISYVGYVLTKLIGEKMGLGITGLVGGLVSSTAVTTSMATQSNKNKKIVIPFVLAIMAASAMMFGRVILVTAILNADLLQYLGITMGIMLVLNILLVLWFWFRGRDSKKVKHKEVELDSPFQLGPALKFGAFFVFILFLIELANHTIGESGFYLTALISGFADVDAITLSMTQVAANNPALSEVAARTITIAVISNTIVKGGIAYLFGGKKFAKYIMASIGAVIVGGLIGIFII